MLLELEVFEEGVDEVVDVLGDDELFIAVFVGIGSAGAEEAADLCGGDGGAVAGAVGEVEIEGVAAGVEDFDVGGDEDVGGGEGF